MEQNIIASYQTLLLRDPSQGEINYWASVDADPSAIAKLIAEAPEAVEIQSVVLPVIGLYQGLLGRAPEAGGLKFWTGAIASGKEAARKEAEAAEEAAAAAQEQLEQAILREQSDVIREIQEQIIQFLKELADARVEMMRAEQQVFKSLVDGFTKAEEFKEVNPGIPDDASAETLAKLFYKNLLDREPDADGLEFWTELLSSGQLTPSGFTAAFVAAEETQSKIGEDIRAYYDDVQDGDIDDSDNDGSLLEEHGEEEPGEPAEPTDPEEPTEPGTGGGGGGGSPDRDADAGDDLTVTVAKVVNAEGSTNVSFKVEGLDADAKAVVTFEDSQGHKITADVLTDGKYKADLTGHLEKLITLGLEQGLDQSGVIGLQDGQITVTIAATDNSGNTAKGEGASFTLDTTADVNGDLAVSIVEAVLNEDDDLTQVAYTVAGLDGDATATVTFTGMDGQGTAKTATGVNNIVDLSGFADGTITASVTTKDEFGNEAKSESDTVDLDTKAPTLTITNSATTTVIAGGTSTVTFIFSEAPVGFAAGDATAMGGSLDAITAIEGSSLAFTALFTPDADFDGSAVITVADDVFTDATENGGAGSTCTIDVDTKVPTVELNAISGGMVNADDANQGLAISGITTGVKDGQILTVSVGGENYTATVSDNAFTANLTAEEVNALAEGTVNVTADVSDGAGNAAVQDTASFTLDTAAPTVTVAIAGTALNNDNKTSAVTFTFSEAPESLESADLMVERGEISNLALDEASNGLVYTATFTADATFEGDGAVTVDSAAYSDAAGNALASTADTVKIDTLAPTSTVVIADANLHDTDTDSSVTITFSEAVTGFVAADDITVSGGTLSTLTTTDNITYTGTFTATDGVDATGSIAVGVSYTDAAGNTGAGGSDTVDIDRVNPTVDVTSGATALSAGQSAVVVFDFSENVLSFDVNDIKFSGGTTSNFMQVASNPSKFQVFFKADDDVDTVGNVNIVGSSYTDAAGNLGVGDSLSFTSQ